MFGRELFAKLGDRIPLQQESQAFEGTRMEVLSTEDQMTLAPAQQTVEPISSCLQTVKNRHTPAHIPSGRYGGDMFFTSMQNAASSSKYEVNSSLRDNPLLSLDVEEGNTRPTTASGVLDLLSSPLVSRSIKQLIHKKRWHSPGSWLTFVTYYVDSPAQPKENLALMEYCPRQLTEINFSARKAILRLGFEYETSAYAQELDASSTSSLLDSGDPIWSAIKGCDFPEVINLFRTRRYTFLDMNCMLEVSELMLFSQRISLLGKQSALHLSKSSIASFLLQAGAKPMTLVDSGLATWCALYEKHHNFDILESILQRGGGICMTFVWFCVFAASRNKINPEYATYLPGRKLHQLL